MGTVIKPQITRSLRHLRLPGFVESFAPQAALAANEGWPYDQYLLTLCEIELSGRQQRKVARMLNESRLPREKTLATFERERLRPAVDKQFSVLLEGGFPGATRQCAGLWQSGERKDSFNMRPGARVNSAGSVSPLHALCCTGATTVTGQGAVETATGVEVAGPIRGADY